MYAHLHTLSGLLFTKSIYSNVQNLYMSKSAVTEFHTENIAHVKSDILLQIMKINTIYVLFM